MDMDMDMDMDMGKSFEVVSHRILLLPRVLCCASTAERLLLSEHYSSVEVFFAYEQIERKED